MEIQAIHDENDYRTHLARVSILVDLDPEVGTPEGDELTIRSLLVENYERQKFPIEVSDPIEALKFRMDQLGLAPKDLVPMIGARHRVHEVLSRKRSLTLKMIRKVHQELHIPAQALISLPKAPQKKSKNSDQAVAV